MHPILFRIGSFPIGTYGLMLAIGLLFGFMLLERRAKKVGLNPDDMMDLTFVTIIIGFIGAKLLFILVNFEGFWNDPLSYIFARSGFVFFGGLITGILAAYIFIRKKQLPPWQIADVVAPSLALAHGFGRVGCFFAGCCFGKPVPQSLEFLAIRFPADSICFNAQVTKGLIDITESQTLPVFPTQLISAAMNFLVFLLLTFLWRKRKFKGQIFASYLIIYSIGRFLVEFLRGDIERGIFAGISTSQILVFFSFLFGIWLYIYNMKKPGLKTS